MFDVDTSGQNFEEDVQTIGFGLVPEKTQGRSAQYDSTIQGYTSRYVHVAYSLGFIVTYEERRDNLYPKLAKARSKSLGFSFRQTKENVLANIYNRAFNSDYAGGDGTELISTTHSTRSGNQSNHLTVAADFSQDACEDLLIQVMGATDDKGMKIGLMAMSLHVPRQLWYEVNRVLKSTLESHTANNATNVLRILGEFPKGTKMNHYFNDADAWFFRTNCPDGMKVYQRDSYKLKQDNDFDTDNAKAKSYDRYSGGWTDWRGVFGSPGA